MAIVVNKLYDSVSISSATNTAAIYSPEAEHVSYTVTVSAASSPNTATIAIQGSIDGTNFATITSTVAVSADVTYTVALTHAQCSYMYYRLVYAIVSGSYTASTQAIFKDI